MDEMSQEATASPCPFSDNLIVKKNKDGSMRLLVDTKLLNESRLFRPRLTTAEKDEIAREVSAISDRAAARILDGMKKNSDNTSQPTPIAVEPPQD
jgi:hypothetical protein